MLRVLVTDNEAIFIKGLKKLLNRFGASLEISGALGGEEALKLLTENRYDAVALDIDMPGMSGLKVLKRIKDLYPELPVLMFSFIPEEDESVSDAFKLGADGYLSKWNALACFPTAIERIVSGAQYYKTDWTEQATGSSGEAKTASPHEVLTESEYEVFRMLAKEKCLREISTDLSMHPNTVIVLRKRVFDKTGFKSTAEIVRYANKMKLL